MEFRAATVRSVTPFLVTFDVGNEQSSKVYKKPKNYTPVIGDRVMFLYDGKSYVCLGAHV